MRGKCRATDGAKRLRRRVVKVRYSRLAALLACAALMGGVAACGDDDDGGGGGAPATPRRARPRARRPSTPRRWRTRPGRRHRLHGQGHGRRHQAGDRGVQQAEQRRDRQSLEFSTSADEQRAQFVQRQEAKSGECDIFSSDVIWTAEFASQKWLYGHDAVRRLAQGRDHPGDARHRHLRRQDLGHAAADGRGASSTTAPTRSRMICRRPGRTSTRPRRNWTASSIRAPPTRA